MLPWYLYALLATIFIVTSDIVLKKMMNDNCNIIYVTLCPVIIAGFIALTYLIFFEKDFIQENVFFSKKYIFIYQLAIFLLFMNYCITCSINYSTNPGYTKAIIATDIIITTILSAYLFNEVTLNYRCLFGILLMFSGILIIIFNS